MSKIVNNAVSLIHYNETGDYDHYNYRGNYMKKVRKPKWCGYEDAAIPVWGCWSLLSHRVTGREFCKSCERYVECK